jgi:transcriptional regulator with XRE-family HTH domain
VKEDTAMELGKKIVEQRKKAQLTQEELASQLYVTRQTLSRWESDVNQPDVESLAKMAVIFHVSTDYFLMEETSPKKPGLTDYQVTLIHQLERKLILTALIAVLVLIGIFLFIYFMIPANGTISRPVVIAVFAVIDGLLVVAILYVAILSLAYAFQSEKYLLARDWQSLYSLDQRMQKVCPKRNRQLYVADQAICLVEMDELIKAWEMLAKVTNVFALDQAFEARTLLLLDEGHYAEAKACYLGYALHYRNGNEVERHACSAYDGFFAALEGNPVTQQQQQDRDDLISAPVAQRLLAKAPLAKEMVATQATISEPASQQNEAVLKTSYEKRDALSGTGDRKCQPWLNIVAVLTLLLPIFLFLILLVSNLSNDPTYLPGSLMGYMGFAAALGLGCLIFGLVAHHKEPQDKYVKNVVIGGITLFLSGLLSLFPVLSQSVYSTDYSYVTSLSEEAKLSLPTQGKVLTSSDTTSQENKLSIRKAAVKFTDENEVTTFVTYISSDSSWITDLSLVSKICYFSTYTFNNDLYAIDYTCLYDKTTSEKNTVPTVSGTYNFVQVSHVINEPWVIIQEYFAFID